MDTRKERPAAATTHAWHLLEGLRRTQLARARGGRKQRGKECVWQLVVVNVLALQFRKPLHGPSVGSSCVPFALFVR
jgi:hypothetical protein